MPLVCPHCGADLKGAGIHGKCPRCAAALKSTDNGAKPGPPVYVWFIGAGVVLAGLLAMIVLVVGLGVYFAAGRTRTAPEAVAADDRLPGNDAGHGGGQNQSHADGVRQDVKPPADAERTTMEPLTPNTRMRMDEAQFLGVQAKGQRFCIIADCSGSMSGNAILELKAETSKTIRDLDPSREFYVVFFHSTAVPMPHPSWVDASKENVDKVLPWIAGIRAQGGTSPKSAFLHAFKLQPRPDVIFFMTDGLIPADVPAAVAQMNGGPTKVTIHTIMFTRNSGKNNIVNIERKRGEPPLRLLAEQSGGTFRHVTEKKENAK